jgi:hypothetical protein
MPVLEVRALPQDPPVDVPAVLGRLCSAVAHAAGCPERQVWATWHTLPDGAYVEGRNDAERQPHETHPPLVRVLALAGRSPENVAAVLQAAGSSLAGSLGLEPGNVFVHYDEIPSGRVLAGGRILG